MSRGSWVLAGWKKAALFCWSVPRSPPQQRSCQQSSRRYPQQTLEMGTCNPWSKKGLMWLLWPWKWLFITTGCMPTLQVRVQWGPENNCRYSKNCGTGTHHLTWGEYGMKRQPARVYSVCLGELVWPHLFWYKEKLLLHQCVAFLVLARSLSWFCLF